MTLLAQAVRQGIQLLYREALIEAYVLGQLCRKQVVPEIALEALDEIDYQRDTLQWDVHWSSPPRIDLRTLTRGAYKDRLIGADSDGRVSNMTTICYIKHFIYWRDSMVHKEIEYVGEILDDGHLSVPEELRHALELAPNVQLQVTIRIVQPDIEQSQAAWEVFRRLGQDAKPGCLLDAAAQHDQYLYGKDT